MCGPALWCEYVMNVTMVLTRGAVWSVEAQESLMPIIVKNAPSRRRIEMVAQRLSIWGALRQISSMNAKNMALKRGDQWVAPASPIKLLQLPRKTPTITSRKGAEPSMSPKPPASVLAPCHPFLPSPRQGWGWKRILHSALTDSPRKTNRLFNGFSWIWEARPCSLNWFVFSTPRAEQEYPCSQLSEELTMNLPPSKKLVLAAALMAVVLMTLQCVAVSYQINKCDVSI